MHPIRQTLFAAACAAVASLSVGPSANAEHAGKMLASARHFDLVNATFDSVTAVAIAPTGDDAFNVVALGEPLHGGLTSMTFDVPAGGCLRDLRVTFQNGRTQLFSHIDVCRSSGLRLNPRSGE
jgi:hypothetical protein